MTTLILEDFLDTPYFHSVVETLKNSSEKDNITIKLKHNTGGLLDLGERLIQVLIDCKAHVALVAEGHVISAAAYVWMHIHLSKSDNIFPNISPIIGNEGAIFIYHRPKAEEGGQVKFIEQIIDESQREEFLKVVKLSDQCLALFLGRYKNFTVFADEDKTTIYTHEEIFDLYVRNSNIHIPININIRIPSIEARKNLIT